MSYISVDVDIDDIISGMSRNERRKFFESMQRVGHIPQQCTIDYEGNVRLSERTERKELEEATDEFNLALEKLFNNGWKLTLEQEQYVINLAKRF